MDINIVLIDDLKMNLIVFEKMLLEIQSEHKINLFSYKDSKQALEFIKKHPVDIVISDYLIPHLTGLDILKQIKFTAALKDILVLIVTSSYDKEVMSACLEFGASDFIRKPVEKFEFIPKIKNLIEIVISQKMLKDRVFLLEEVVAQATRTIKSRELEIIHRLAVATEYRDQETGRHIQRVSEYSRLLAEKIGLDKDTQELLEKASPLHDIGKIAIPDHILLKPGKFTEKERITMNNHTLYGYKILYDPRIPLLDIAAEIALYHHERWDGGGYPYGKKKEEIPIYARITTIADIFDAWTSPRKYKKAWTFENACMLLLQEKEKIFDPKVVDKFIGNKKDFFAIYERLRDN